ncbi:MAG: hypothetical protein ACYDG4_09915 [Desulfuromonadaceae bacterium]
MRLNCKRYKRLPLHAVITVQSYRRYRVPSEVTAHCCNSGMRSSGVVGTNHADVEEINTKGFDAVGAGNAGNNYQVRRNVRPCLKDNVPDMFVSSQRFYLAFYRRY